MKKIISILLGLTVIFTINTNVYATTTPVTDTLKSIGLVVEDFKQANQYTWTQISDFLDTMSQFVGLPKKGHSSGGHSFDPQIIHDIDPTVDPEDPDSVGSWIGNQINIQDNDNITVSNDFRTMFNDFNDSMSKSYIYTLDVLKNGVVSNMNVYFALRDTIRNDTDHLYLIYTFGSQPILYKINFIDFPYLYATSTNIASNNNMVSAKLYDMNTGLQLVQSQFEGNKYNPDTNKFDIPISGTSSAVQAWAKYNLNTSSNSSAYSNTWFLVSCNVTIPIRYFQNGTTPTVQDIMYQPYYYNNDVWQDFSTSSGDYTFDASNFNSVSYGDITQYIDSYNQENGSPPSAINIEIEIKNKDTENKDDTSGGGGGSGSGGDDSGDDDPTNIFGWLKQLGKVLGDLIKGLGEFLTEVVTGLVSALTNLLSGIADLISNITETLPAAFMDWFASLFEWMPAEWKALLSASLVFMVLWGIIKVIRG